MYIIIQKKNEKHSFKGFGTDYAFS